MEQFSFDCSHSNDNINQAIKCSITGQYQKMAVVLYVTPWLPLLEVFYKQCIDSGSTVSQIEEVSSPMSSTNSLSAISATTPSSSFSSLSAVNKGRRRSSPAESTPFKTSSAQSPSTASFVYSTPEAAGSMGSPKIGSHSLRKDSGKEVSLKLMGGRVVDISMEQFLEDMEDLFEVCNFQLLLLLFYFSTFCIVRLLLKPVVRMVEWVP